ncbi:MAG: YdcF family protein [Clostridia bacterium]|nr:YdcF family protein [Clostridia bacterium]
MKKRIRICFVVLSLAALAAISAVFCLNAYVKAAGAERMLSPETAAELSDIDCILVLGCGVRPDGSPSDMLADRLQRGIDLYSAGAAPKLLMSGDHGTKGYNEVGAMKAFADAAGVPAADVFLDHAGFSTYESVYRAKEIFKAERVIIVTQGYHLHRALYIARELGLEAWGVDADLRSYYGQTARDVREILARCKDFAMCIFKPEPTYLGDSIPVSGDGKITHD